mmetsp:Transcript_23707/g.36614  ORF Transcript_23707/g.36614 Transcript_23707/m.36614 type:complete len:105 (+) Transcript_23707:131-445(+)
MILGISFLDQLNQFIQCWTHSTFRKVVRTDNESSSSFPLNTEKDFSDSFLRLLMQHGKNEDVLVMYRKALAIRESVWGGRVQQQNHITSYIDIGLVPQNNINFV